MKNVIILLAILFANAEAQTYLNFNKRFDECEDKWVAFQMNKDSSYIYGFIYLDLEAGLTIKHEGTFKINSENVFIPKKLDSIFSIRSRIQPNGNRVAIIPESKFSELNIKKFPEWLKFYKDSTDSIQWYVEWGFLYNDWNESAKALTFLEKAYSIDPNHKRLEFELAFAYNVLEEYDKAIEVLDKAIKNNRYEYLFYKELVYAYGKKGLLEKAGEACNKAISTCIDYAMRGEMSYNVAQGYYFVKDKENFLKWANESKKWLAENSPYYKNIILMESTLRK